MTMAKRTMGQLAHDTALVCIADTGDSASCLQIVGPNAPAPLGSLLNGSDSNLSFALFFAGSLAVTRSQKIRSRHPEPQRPLRRRESARSTAPTPIVPGARSVATREREINNTPFRAGEQRRHIYTLERRE